MVILVRQSNALTPATKMGNGKGKRLFTLGTSTVSQVLFYIFYKNMKAIKFSQVKLYIYLQTQHKAFEDLSFLATALQRMMNIS